MAVGMELNLSSDFYSSGLDSQPPSPWLPGGF